MRISVIGTGYVGLVTGACFAERGHDVTCVDKDSVKITSLDQGHLPIYEEGLKDLVVSNARKGRLRFTVELKRAVDRSEVIFIAVGTPPGPNGEADLSQVRFVSAAIGKAMPGYRLIVNKSTVPVGTADLVSSILRENTSSSFDVVSNPEFLREGMAVHDCLHPERIIIGSSSQRAVDTMKRLYEGFRAPVLVMDARSAELTKYASNAFLATKISFINEIANLSEKLGADVTQVAKGMGLDSRIGAGFLRAGVGYGGSCFPKDTSALIEMGRRVEYDMPMVKAAVQVNHDQRLRLLNKLEGLIGDLTGKRVTVLGLAFKPNTDDVRESPAIDIVRHIVVRGGLVSAHDPQAMENFRRLGPDVDLFEDVYEAVSEVDGIILVTDWEDYSKLDWNRIASVVRRKLVLDGRNVLNALELSEIGFEYHGVGRPARPASYIDSNVMRQRRP